MRGKQIVLGCVVAVVCGASVAAHAGTGLSAQTEKNAARVVSNEGKKRDQLIAAWPGVETKLREVHGSRPVRAALKATNKRIALATRPYRDTTETLYMTARGLGVRTIQVGPRGEQVEFATKVRYRWIGLNGLTTRLHATGWPTLTVAGIDAKLEAALAELATAK
jgi:hypothetical protein